MAQKIMLVEDDTNLGEIYKARLEAESFQVISAKDGEEALAIAVKEHPDLIISDVMMPKISGFDMLDILRGTEGVKNTKVIMMTALGQSEDKARADKLGADRYLVKSQVTLEDVVKAVHEVLDGTTAAPAVTSAPTPAQPATNPSLPDDTTTAVTQIPIVEPPAEATTPPSTPAPNNPTTVDASLSKTDQDEKAEVLSQIQDFVDKQEAASKPTETTASPASAEHSTKVIQPLGNAEPTATSSAPSTTTSEPRPITVANEPSASPSSTPTSPNASDPNSVAL